MFLNEFKYRMIKTVNKKRDLATPNLVAVPHHLNAEPDPAFHFNADPDPPFHFNADPDQDPAPHQSN